jgi:hypothetical protein
MFTQTSFSPLSEDRLNSQEVNKIFREAETICFSEINHIKQPDEKKHEQIIYA